MEGSFHLLVLQGALTLAASLRTMESKGDQIARGHLTQPVKFRHPICYRQAGGSGVGNQMIPADQMTKRKASGGLQDRMILFVGKENPEDLLAHSSNARPQNINEKPARALALNLSKD
jgi:hypothetical protein